MSNTQSGDRPVHPGAQGICGCPLYLDSKVVEHRDGCPFPVAAAQAATWNDWFADRKLSPLDAPVRYWMGVREGEGRTGTARTDAQVLSGHTAVIWVNEAAGAIALTHVENLTVTYTDARGEHWHPGGHDEFGQGWLRCLETDRGARNIEAVEQEFGPLVKSDSRPNPSGGADRG